MGRETDEPRIDVVVGRACLPGRRQREAGLPRAVAGAMVDDIGEHARHHEGCRLAHRPLGLLLVAVEDLTVPVFDAADQDRRTNETAAGERAVRARE